MFNCFLSLYFKSFCKIVWLGFNFSVFLFLGMFWFIWCIKLVIIVFCLLFIKVIVEVRWLESFMFLILFLRFSLNVFIKFLNWFFTLLLISFKLSFFKFLLWLVFLKGVLLYLFMFGIINVLILLFSNKIL